MATAKIIRPHRGVGQTYAPSGSTAYAAEKNADASGASALGTTTDYGLWEHMLRTNPIVAISYLGLAATMQSAEPVIDDRNGKVDPAVVAYVEELLFERMLRRFQDVTRTMWLCVPLGVAPHERTVYTADGYVWLRDVQHRPMRSFEHTGVWRDADGYIHGKQQCYDPSPHARASHRLARYGGPADWANGAGWLWWPTYGEGLFGTPLLRPIVTEHQNKEDIRRGFGIDVQKVLTPTPVVYQKEPTDIEGADDDEWQTTLNEIGAVLGDAESVLGVPPSVEKIESLYEGRDSEVISRAIEAENHADTQVLLLFGAPYMARGIFSGVGTNAAGRVDAAEQRNFRRFFLDTGSSLLQDLIDPMVDINFGEQRYYPEVRYLYHQELTPLERARCFATYRGAGLLSVSDADEDAARDEIGVPLRSNDASPRRDSAAGAAETPGMYDDKTGEDTRERPSQEDADHDDE